MSSNEINSGNCDEKPCNPNIFHMEEFKALKVEVTEMLKALQNLVIFNMTVAAVVYSWLGAKEILKENISSESASAASLGAVWFIPFGVALLSSVYSYAIWVKIGFIGEYLRRIEDRFALVGLGWEAFFKKSKAFDSKMIVMFWVIFIIFNALVAVLVNWKWLGYNWVFPILFSLYILIHVDLKIRGLVKLTKIKTGMKLKARPKSKMNPDKLIASGK